MQGLRRALEPDDGGGAARVRPVALIVEWQTPDLLALCLASLTRFAPEVTPLVLTGGPGPEWHARAIEKARPLVLDLGYDPVILLDTDTCILSKRWWKHLSGVLFLMGTRGHDLAGAHRTRGDYCQLFEGSTPKLHASMLGMRRALFQAVDTFAAEPEDQELGCVVRDTAWRASVLAECRYVFPAYPVTRGPIFPGLQVGEFYWGPDDTEPLWSHLWRGTGMPAGGPLRQAIRRVRAVCGSRSAQTVLRATERKARWMERAWEVVRA